MSACYKIILSFLNSKSESDFKLFTELSPNVRVNVQSMLIVAESINSKIKEIMKENYDGATALIER